MLTDAMNAIFTQIICINKLIWDRCCCSTICVSCAFAFALCFFRVFYRMSMWLCFFSFLANKTKTNKVLGFSVWLIFFSHFFFEVQKSILLDCFYQAKVHSDHPKRRWCVFSCVLKLKIVLIWCWFWYHNDFNLWLNPWRRTTMKMPKTTIWCGLRVVFFILVKIIAA